jgi:hypothetical protein
MKEQEPSLKNSIFKAGNALYRAFPLILGTVLLVSLFSLIPKLFFTTIFSGTFLDPIIGATIGSISAGNPVSSYILGGELLDNGVSLIAVTAFLLAWVTVGLVQLPAESFMLGKKFAITRNILSFIFSIIVALITVGILSIL